MFSPIIGLGFSSGGKSKNNISDIIKKNIDKGAKEFFTGYTPSYWYKKFGFEVSPNGRFSEPEQVTKKEDLITIIQEVHKNEAKIMGNLNAWYYNGVCEEEIKKIIEDFLEAGIDGFICGNLGILEYLKIKSSGEYEKGFIIKGKKIQINISTIMAVYNKDAIQFLLEEYPIGKIILSREITLEEIESILLDFPTMTFEVFGEGDFCRYNNGLCFAEHKYTDRDICTIVVNDLIIKKAIKYDFRKIIQKEGLENNEKIIEFNNKYITDFEKLEILLLDIELEEGNYEENMGELKILSLLIKNKYTLYYDPLKSVNSKGNKNIRIYLKSIKLLSSLSSSNQIFFEDLIIYLSNEIKIGIKSNLLNLKYKNISKEKDLFYNRSDLLNLYSYFFFDKFNNIDTVKFPTRGRNYLPKITLIETVLKEKEEKIINNLSFESLPNRAHYDLRYLFGNNKKWFYELRIKLQEKILNNL